MATDWGPVLQTATGAAAAIIGGFVGAWMQGRNQQRSEQQQRRERAADVLAEVTALLEDANPVVLDHGDPEQTLMALIQRRDKLRMGLLRLATAHPAAPVRELAGRLDTLLWSSLNAMSYVVGRLRTDGDEHRREVAKGMHGKTMEALGELIDAVQRA